MTERWDECPSVLCLLGAEQPKFLRALHAFRVERFYLAAKTQELQDRLKRSIARFCDHLQNVNTKEYSAREKKYGRRKIKTRKSFYLCALGISRAVKHLHFLSNTKRWRVAASFILLG